MQLTFPHRRLGTAGTSTLGSGACGRETRLSSLRLPSQGKQEGVSPEWEEEEGRGQPEEGQGQEGTGQVEQEQGIQAGLAWWENLRRHCPTHSDATQTPQHRRRGGVHSQSLALVPQAPAAAVTSVTYTPSPVAAHPLSHFAAAAATHGYFVGSPPLAHWQLQHRPLPPLPLRTAPPAETQASHTSTAAKKMVTRGRRGAHRARMA